MRILWLTENYPPRRGGMAQACDRIVHNLRKAGMLVDLVFFSCAATETRVIERQNGREIVAAMGESHAHDLNCLYNLLTSPANRQDYTHIVAFGGNLPVIALPIFKAWLGCRAITLFRGNDFDLGVFVPQRRLALYDAIAASDAVCVLSSEMRQRVASLRPQANIRMITNGIDLDMWQPQAFDIDNARKWRAENSSATRLVVGLIGQFKNKKGGLFFLENVIAAGLENAMQFLIVGDMEPAMQSWLNEKQQALKASVMPFTDRFELICRYLACDFIALPSHYDGMPNVLLEAGALGLPVIAARTGGISEVLPAETQTLTFHPGDAEGCRQALQNAVFMSADNRQLAGKALQTRINNDFTVARETSAYLQLINSI